MANICDYSLKVIGKERRNVEKFLCYLKNNYCYYSDDDHLTVDEQKKSKYRFCFDDGSHHLLTDDEKHFFRVFECIGYEEDENNFPIIKEEDGQYYSLVYGDCAWSVYSCMMKGPCTYYSNNADEYINLRQKHATNLQDITSELNLKVEVYSCESGMCFSEHYVVDNGDLIVEEEFDYNEYQVFDYSSKEEAEKNLNIKFTKQEWENRGDYITRCAINPYNPTWQI